jgi:DNA-binding transcriptional MerR regulator
MINRRHSNGFSRADMLGVGDFAATAGVNVQTIRFYERERLLPQPERTAGGHRLYGDADVARLRFIQGAKSCGFTLREIRDLLALRQSDLATCTDVRERAETKLAETEAKLARLTELRSLLKKLIRDCPGGKVGVDHCNILRELEGGKRVRRGKA